MFNISLSQDLPKQRASALLRSAFRLLRKPLLWTGRALVVVAGLIGLVAWALVEAGGSDDPSY